ncbi:hypothetical protein B0A48_14034 [Cryoendolithus antarcticus]|uniref:Uncharacterized protein n=1 Tax=Cryoendolithus antarcticus TaxID=1507870 RepID=A0A1V8SM53_9PEZI|nr:hypothetical protein B0A48_14034 [Cryoendolithus antarcticus]
MDSALVTSIHSLPPELYEIIRDYTLQFDSNQHTFITAIWRPPDHIHLNQATRTAFLNNYLFTTIFDFSSLSTGKGVILCARWLKSLPRSSRLGRPRHLRFASSYASWTPPLDCSTLWRCLQVISDKAADRIALEDADPAASIRLI